MAYTNSPLVTYTKITNNKTRNRNHKIDTITIHCIVGQWTAKQGCDYFAKTTRQASCNYVVGKDGSIGLCVEEKDRSWCTSSSSNDNRAITIECASDTTHPYAVTDAAYDALIRLVADVCKRNGIKKLLWQNSKALIGQVEKQNMTVHCWFSRKSCPGQYLLDHHSDIANRVNAILGVSTAPAMPTRPDANNLYRVQTGAFKNKTNANAEMKKVEAAGFDATVAYANNLYSVQVGAFSKKADAMAMQARLKTAGFSTMIVTNKGVVSQTTAIKPITVGATVRVNKGSKTYSGGKLASFVYDRNHRVDSVSGARAVISYNGVVVCAINVKDLTVV